MPYKPTGRPNGRPRKQPLPEVAEQPTPANRRQRKEFKPAPSRRFVSGTAPQPFAEPADTAAPVFGQRKRVKARRPGLHPTPLKA